ncbi:zeta toxin family protein [uncultured Ruminococcus sp.]|uniref:zeta toxin family protein n=1 Tax=uncultured Ruminococcus sp. TaxID=165186 RepID=UPI00292D7705|nr:zeta toxin family protein [uncultured Ruminococcus sp.]
MPRLVIFAGPNGSGKSTVTSKFGVVGEYVNADEIKKALDCTDMEAALKAEQIREYFLSKKQDFTFETVMSTDRNLKLIAKAKQEGYYVSCIYILTSHPDINIARVKARFEGGGHPVPVDKIRERYMRALRLIPVLISLCDEFLLFDNSPDKADVRSGLLFRKEDKDLKIFPNDIWNTNMLKSLFNGTYPDDYIH